MSGSDTEQAKGAGEAPLGSTCMCRSARRLATLRFYQTQPTAETVLGFLDGVKTEAGLTSPWPRPVTTVFWGGGTRRFAGAAADRGAGSDDS